MARLLVADDDPELALLVEMTLASAGHSVKVVQDPERILSVAVEEPFDALVLDVVMPGLSGIEVLRKLQSHPATAHLPVLLLSALNDAADRVQGLREGAADYLAKPFDPDELILRVERLLEQAPGAGHALEGRIEQFPIWELLQSLEQGQRSGVLELPGVGARLELAAGTATRAQLGSLEGREAALAICLLERGRFRFTPAVDPAVGQGIPIRSLLLSAALVRDELELRRDFLPPFEQALAAVVSEVPPVPESFEEVPVSLVYMQLLDHPGITLADLLAREQAAPEKVQLAIAWLVEQALVVPSTAKAGSVERTDPPAQVSTPTGNVLILGWPGSWPALLDLVEAAAKDDPAAPWAELAAELGLRRGGSTVLLSGNDVAILYVQILTPTTSGRLAAMLPICRRFVLWLDADSSEAESAPIASRLAGLRDAAGVILAPVSQLPPSLAQLAATDARWQTTTTPPPSLLQLLAALV